MNQLVKNTGLVIVALFWCAGTYAEDASSLYAYVLLQDCMAEAAGVTDNGSYERYCMDVYQLAMQDNVENN